MWIPGGDVKTRDKGTIKIELKRYVFNDNGTVNANLSKTEPEEKLKVSTSASEYYTEGLKNSVTTNTHAKDIADFRAKAKRNHGYYIGRYEARTTIERKTKDDNLTQITTKPNDYVYNRVTQQQAATLSRGMYEGTPFESDLVNSYAWDTATLFLQTFDNRTNKDSLKKYSRQNSLNTRSDRLATQGTNKLDSSKQDKICNVYDMASNCWEWSTETYSYSNEPCTRRGGYYGYSDNYTSTRSCYTTIESRSDSSFRPLLYL